VQQRLDLRRPLPCRQRVAAVEDLQLGLRIEGQPAIAEQVEHAAQRPDVDRRAHELARVQVPHLRKGAARGQTEDRQGKAV
jgi:hypothetical protein